jgi:hypothetical protein
MTGVSVIFISLMLVGVFAAFWWLVELSGGAAGSALSVARSMQTGIVSWRGPRSETPIAALPDEGSRAPEPAGDLGLRRSSNESFEVPLTAVRRERVQRR